MLQFHLCCPVAYSHDMKEMNIDLFTDIAKHIANDPWFKIVEFLQQTWAVLIEQDDTVLVVFYGDTCGVFDQISFDDQQTGEAALRRNGFSKYKDDPKAQEFIALPDDEFHVFHHPNGFIYSSGKYWR